MEAKNLSLACDEFRGMVGSAFNSRKQFL